MYSDLEEEIKDIQQTSKKIENISKKEGLREGICAGRESNFQESFNKGFEEGFKNGFILGKHKGTLIAQSKQKTIEEKLPPILESASNGSCEICNNKETIGDEEDIDALIEYQKKTYENNVKMLNSISIKDG